MCVCVCVHVFVCAWFPFLVQVEVNECFCKTDFLFAWTITAHKIQKTYDTISPKQFPFFKELLKLLASQQVSGDRISCGVLLYISLMLCRLYTGKMCLFCPKCKPHSLLHYLHQAWFLSKNTKGWYYVYGFGFRSGVDVQVWGRMLSHVYLP